MTLHEATEAHSKSSWRARSQNLPRFVLSRIGPAKQSLSVPSSEFIPAAAITPARVRPHGSDYKRGIHSLFSAGHLGINCSSKRHTERKIDAISQRAAAGRLKVCACAVWKTIMSHVPSICMLLMTIVKSLFLVIFFTCTLLEFYLRRSYFEIWNELIIN